MDELSDNTGRVLQYIQQNPGCHLRQIKRELDMSMGTVQYHLNLLEKMGRVASERQNLHRFYFPIGIFESNERNVLKILNQDTAREILMLILERKNPIVLRSRPFYELQSLFLEIGKSSDPDAAFAVFKEFLILYS